jgi:hypothetical protein
MHPWTRGAPRHARNVASGEVRTVVDLAEAPAAAHPPLSPRMTGQLRTGDVRQVFASPARATSVRGFGARVQFAAGLVELTALDDAGAGTSRPIRLGLPEAAATISTTARFSRGLDQVKGNGGCHHQGVSDGSIDASHFTHQKPRRPGATSRAGAPWPAESGRPPTAVATRSRPRSPARATRELITPSGRVTRDPQSKLFPDDRARGDTCSRV